MSGEGAVVISLSARRRGPAGAAATPIVRAERNGGPAEGAPRERTAIWWCIAAALALHGAAVAVALYEKAEPLSGGAGQYLEAISVDIVPSAALASRGTRPDETESDAARENPDRARQEAQKPQEKSDSEPVPAPPPPVESPPEQPESKPEPPTQSPSVAARAMSPGALARYAREVRAALDKNAPNGHGIRGTATVTFVISPAGTLASAHVSGVSGSRALDEAALAAVRRTSFPRPPEGMTETQLTYVIPFHFK